MERRLEQVDKRFEEMRTDMLARLSETDRRLDALEHRMDRLMRWPLGLTLTVGVLVVAAIKVLP